MRFTKPSFLTLLLFILFHFTESNLCAQKITFRFENQPLGNALDSLIFNHNIPLLYLKKQVENSWVTEQCNNCNETEALNAVLNKTNLKFKEVNQRFILYNSETETVYLKKDDKVSLKGTVIDSLTHEPLPFASVLIEGNKGIATNKDGTFTIGQLTPDTYKLKIFYMGYTSDSILVDLCLPQNGQSWEIKLSPSQTEIDVVVVKTNEIQQNPISSGMLVSKLYPKRLKSIPTMDQGDILQNVMLLPEISTLPDNLSGFTLRGGTMEQTLVTLDDIPLYHTSHLWGFNSSQNADAIESISVFTGGFPAQYGNRLSGIIDMKGLISDNKKLEGSLSVNLFSVKSHLSVPLHKNANLLLSANTSSNFFNYNEKILNRSDYMFFNQYIQAYGYGLDDDNAAYARGTTFPKMQKNNSTYYDLYGKLDVKLNRNDTLSVSGIFNHDQITMKATIDIKDIVHKEEIEGNRKERWNTMGFGINYRRCFTPLVKLSSGFTWSDYLNSTEFIYKNIPSEESNYEQKTAFRNYENNIRELKVYTNLNWKMTDYSALSCGIDYQSIGTEYDQTAKGGIETYDGVFTGLFSNIVKTNEYNGFIEQELHLFKAIKLNLGIRSAYLENSKTLFVEPRLQAKIQLNSELSLQSSWGKFHQNLFSTPSYVSINMASFNSSNTWLMAQPGLQPSTSEHWIAGISYVGKNFSARISGYYKSMNDLAMIIPADTRLAKIDTTNASFQTISDWLKNRNFITNHNTVANNIPIFNDKLEYDVSNKIDYYKGSGYSKGVELFISKDKGIYNGFVSYRLSKTTYQFPFINMGKVFLSENDRTHELKIMNSILWKNWNVGTVYTVASGKPYPGRYKVKAFYTHTYVIVDHPVRWDLKSTERTLPFHNLDISISKKMKLNKRVELLVGASLHNALNHNNELSKYNTITTDGAVAGFASVSNDVFTQYGVGRLLNVFAHIHF